MDSGRVGLAPNFSRLSHCQRASPLIIVTTLFDRRSVARSGNAVHIVQCREPRGNRGRSRHCIGLQTPRSHCAARRGKAGARFEARSQDIG